MIFLFQSPHPWRGIAQRPHHLARRFARRGHRVHWVEPKYLRWLTQRPGDFWRAKDEQPETNIRVRPQLLINGERLGFIRAHNKYWLARTMKAGLEGAPSKDPRVLWLYNPHEAHLAASVPHDLLIYDIMDEFRGFPWSPPDIEAEERALLEKADWVFAGTGALHDAKRALAESKIECELSGVETKFFSSPMPIEHTTAEYRQLRKKYKRIAGYAGMVDLRLDQPLLDRAAAELDDWGFVIIGPVRGGVRFSAPNIHLLGPQPYEALPAYYQSWNAALLPFVENELTRHINPTKMVEYAAAGTPIVASALPDVKRYYANGAWLYSAPGEFISRLREITIATPDGLHASLEQARTWSHERDWDAIADRMLRRIERLLRK